MPTASYNDGLFKIKEMNDCHETVYVTYKDNPATVRLEKATTGYKVFLRYSQSDAWMLVYRRATKKLAIKCAKEVLYSAELHTR